MITDLTGGVQPPTPPPPPPLSWRQMTFAFMDVEPAPPPPPRCELCGTLLSVQPGRSRKYRQVTCDGCGYSRYEPIPRPLKGRPNR
jgi:hypothetical protein